MTEKRAYLLHGRSVAPEGSNAPVNKCATFSDAAALLTDFWQMWEPYSLHDQLCLAVPDDTGEIPFAEQLVLGCGSLKREHSKYSDKDFTNLVVGAEFLQPMFDYAIQYGYEPCRPMIRYLAPKTCLSYHQDDAGVRFHLVLQTHWSAFFVVQDTVYRMPEVGALYSLKTNVMHTAVNADIARPRIHFTFSGYKD